MQTRILISDDEYSGRATMEILLKKLMYNRSFHYEIASSLDETREMLRKHQYDLIFLDINFKGVSSFSIMDEIPKETKLVFVTAYSEHAIDAIRSNAFDYLMKPLKEIELSSCLNRYFSLIGTADSSATIPVREKGFTRLYKISDITHVKGNGPYSTLFTKEEQITTARTLKSLIPELGQNFVRIHKSYLVNRNFIKGFQKDQIFLTHNICLPISRTGLKNLSS
jgi:two-component system LytT family response regulator